MAMATTASWGALLHLLSDDVVNADGNAVCDLLRDASTDDERRRAMAAVMQSSGVLRPHCSGRVWRQITTEIQFCLSKCERDAVADLDLALSAMGNALIDLAVWIGRRSDASVRDGIVSLLLDDVEWSADLAVQYAGACVDLCRGDDRVAARVGAILDEVPVEDLPGLAQQTGALRCERKAPVLVDIVRRSWPATTRDVLFVLQSVLAHDADLGPGLLRALSPTVTDATVCPDVCLMILIGTADLHIDLFMSQAARHLHDTLDSRIEDLARVWRRVRDEPVVQRSTASVLDMCLSWIDNGARLGPALLIQLYGGARHCRSAALLAILDDRAAHSMLGQLDPIDSDVVLDWFDRVGPSSASMDVVGVMAQRLPIDGVMQRFRKALSSRRPDDRRVGIDGMRHVLSSGRAPDSIQMECIRALQLAAGRPDQAASVYDALRDCSLSGHVHAELQRFLQGRVVRAEQKGWKAAIDAHLIDCYLVRVDDRALLERCLKVRGRLPRSVCLSLACYAVRRLRDGQLAARLVELAGLRSLQECDDPMPVCRDCTLIRQLLLNDSDATGSTVLARDVVVQEIRRAVNAWDFSISRRDHAMSSSSSSSSDSVDLRRYSTAAAHALCSILHAAFSLRLDHIEVVSSWTRQAVDADSGKCLNMPAASLSLESYRVALLDALQFLLLSLPNDVIVPPHLLGADTADVVVDEWSSALLLEIEAGTASTSLTMCYISLTSYWSVRAGSIVIQTARRRVVDVLLHFEVPSVRLRRSLLAYAMRHSSSPAEALGLAANVLEDDQWDIKYRRGVLPTVLSHAQTVCSSARTSIRHDVESTAKIIVNVFSPLIILVTVFIELDDRRSLPAITGVFRLGALATSALQRVMRQWDATHNDEIDQSVREESLTRLESSFKIIRQALDLVDRVEHWTKCYRADKAVARAVFQVATFENGVATLVSAARRDTVFANEIDLVRRALKRLHKRQDRNSSGLRCGDSSAVSLTASNPVRKRHKSSGQRFRSRVAYIDEALLENPSDNEAYDDLEDWIVD
ncbi:Uncharacterized protein PBTT_02739 [Plasmodiophora brassicae]